MQRKARSPGRHGYIKDLPLERTPISVRRCLAGESPPSTGRGIPFTFVLDQGGRATLARASPPYSVRAIRAPSGSERLRRPRSGNTTSVFHGTAVRWVLGAARREPSRQSIRVGPGLRQGLGHFRTPCEIALLVERPPQVPDHHVGLFRAHDSHLAGDGPSWYPPLPS